MLLVDIEGSRCPTEEEAGSGVVVASTILNLISMHPSKPSEVLLLLVKTAVFTHLVNLSPVDMPFRVFVLS